MPQETVKVKVDTTEVEDIEDRRDYRHNVSLDRTAFRGNVSFDEHSFKYHLRFGVSLERLEELSAQNPEEAMRQIHLDVTDSQGRAITLDDKAKALFIATAGTLSIELSRSQDCRDYLTPITFGMVDSINHGLSSEYRLHRSPELEKFLETYKK